MTYERVHTVWDYYEGPRSGIADFAGEAYYFINEYDEDKDDYTTTFSLRKIDAATLQMIVKQRQMWRTWELAFHRGERDKSTHPALPGQDETYAQLGIEIKTELDTLSSSVLFASAVFRDRPNQPQLPKGMMQEFEVEWTPR